MSLVQKSVTHHETVESKRWRNDDAWEPEQIQYVFTAWAECRHPSCKQRFAISGTGGTEPQYDDEGSTEWVDYFSPRHCDPMPDVIELPVKCPDEVAKELRAAFALFWAQPEPCAGRIRVAVEALLDHIGVPKKTTTAKGKQIDLKLHERIEAFAVSNAVTGPHLMALKWLGNAGSHGSRVSRIDLLDAFEIMEHALVEILDKRSAKVAALAEKMTKKHAPKKP